jgi:hypothetical protein
MKTKSFKLEEITLDRDLQCRAGSGPFGCYEETIEAYSEAYTEGKTLPPITVIELAEHHGDHEMGTILLVGGWHRFLAARKAGLTKIEATLHTGSWTDALILSWAQNGDHGRPRSSRDLKMVLDQVCLVYSKSSVREIARLANCSHGAVQRYRTEKKGGGTTTKPKPEMQSQPEPLQVIDDEPETQSEEKELTVHGGHPEPEPETPPEPDKWSEIRATSQTMLDIASDLKSIGKSIDVLKKEVGGARLQAGHIKKGIREAEQHLEWYRPYAVLPADHGLDPDPTDGLGWVTYMQFGRLDDSIATRCEKL